MSSGNLERFINSALTKSGVNSWKYLIIKIILSNSAEELKGIGLSIIFSA